ncbi:polyribonucleotide nucleotidyltransferase [Corallococcus sp. CAG:1435]|nr:polyribonucleotide nucleotidyltransferase [Corallococcus sp. CAG:1435]
MKQSVDVLVKFDECAVRHQASNFSRNNGTDGEFFLGKFPRFGLQLFVSQGHTVVFSVQSKHYEFVGLADFQNFLRRVYTFPGKVGSVCKAIETTHVHKCAETCKTQHFAFHNFVNGDIVPEFVFLCLLFCKQNCLLAGVNNTFVVVYLFGIAYKTQCLADVLFQILNVSYADLRSVNHYRVTSQTTGETVFRCSRHNNGKFFAFFDAVNKGVVLVSFVDNLFGKGYLSVFYG